ncbi:DUF1648 domain-containing protein [Microbispora sp. NEAU-D428]|uniref:DUF1648 domain-containing protein n=1 Tax=Microbispora sitophila TaxID=2771537 RepID=UPI0018690A99|nr:DUF1648 domain-containing protein [Microbispora sitophila]MBE3009192.1 DUF1648 domain-containing protein [Microbispora sitophila]
MTDPHDRSVTGFRTRFLVAASAWAVLVGVVLVAVPLAYADRLPDPLATHWGQSGRPDGSMPFAAFVLLLVVLWVVVAGIGTGVTARARTLVRRVPRAWSCAGLAWAGGFMLITQAFTIAANLDRGHWTRAAGLNWQVAVVVAAPIAFGALGWLAGRHGPDVPSGPPQARPLIDLDPGKRPVWVSTTTAPWATWLAIVALAAAVALAGTALSGRLPGGWSAVVPLTVVGVAGLALSSVSVRVVPEALTVSIGPLRWPSRTVRLERVERAWVEERYPAQVGGWGYRGLPGRATIMIRGGECLVVRYTSGGRLAISVDDAEAGAALLNALIARQRPSVER